MFRETYGRRLLGTRVEAVLLVQEHEQSLVTTRNEGEAKGDTHSGGGAGPDGSWKRGQRPPPEESPRGRLESHNKEGGHTTAALIAGLVDVGEVFLNDVFKGNLVVAQVVVLSRHKVFVLLTVFIRELIAKQGGEVLMRVFFGLTL